MARVRMLVTVSGTRDGVGWPAKGGVLVVSDVEASGLIDAGLAVPVAQAVSVERATSRRKTETRAAS